MTDTATELFVYYKLKPEQAEAARAAFERARGHAAVRLLQRSDGALLTWMEIYGPGLAQPEVLEQQVAAVMAGFAVGARHIESFRALTPST